MFGDGRWPLLNTEQTLFFIDALTHKRIWNVIIGPFSPEYNPALHQRRTIYNQSTTIKENKNNNNNNDPSSFYICTFLICIVTFQLIKLGQWFISRETEWTDSHVKNNTSSSTIVTFKYIFVTQLCTEKTKKIIQNKDVLSFLHIFNLSFIYKNYCRSEEILYIIWFNIGELELDLCIFECIA